MIEAIRDLIVLGYTRFRRSWIFMVLMRPFLIALITLNSVFTRERMSHENGLVARGYVRIREDLNLPKNAFFKPGDVFPCRLRHASVSFMDDAALVVRAASIKFADQDVKSPFDMLMNNGNATPFWNMDTFWQFMRCRMRGGRVALVDYFRRNPRCYMNVRDAVRRDPTSFANLFYYSQIPVEFHAADRRPRYAKFRLIPADHDEEFDGRPSEEDLRKPWFQEARSHEARGRNYLKDEYRGRLAQGPVHYRFQIQLLDWQDGMDRNYELNSLYPWDEDLYPWRDLADVQINAALDHAEGNQCLFSLRHLPKDSLRVVPAKGFVDGASIDYLRLGGWWPRRARLLMYRLKGQKPPIPDTRERTAVDNSDRTTSTLDTDDIYMRPALPQKDTPRRRLERARQLEEARGLYQYYHGYIRTEATGGTGEWQPEPPYERVFDIYEADPAQRSTVPVPLPPFIRKLPAGEQYSQYIQGRLYKIIGASIVSILLSYVETWLTRRQGLEVYRNLFALYRDKPRVMSFWREDEEFGRQRLAGLNPTIIRRFDAVPAKFPVTDRMIGHLIGGSIAEAIAAKRLYWCDYAILDGISVKEGRYLAHPVVLFCVSDRGQLMPVAIQLYQSPDKGPVFTPDDDPDLWLAVKSFVQSADAQVHEVVEHLLHGHLIVEIFDVAMHRTLPVAHPVHKLLAPHMEFTMAVNNSARSQMLAPGGPIDATMAIGAKGAFELLARAWWEQWDYARHNVPADLARRGVDDADALPGYHWRDDALALWQVIKRYVGAMVEHFYASDADVAEDWELQAFHAEIRDPSGGNVRDVPGGADGFRDRATLVEFLTQLIYMASAGHAAGNNGQYDFYGFVPNTPGALYAPPPASKTGDLSEQDLADAMPPFRAASIQILMVRLLSRRTEMPIGRFYPGFFAGTQSVLPIVTRFRHELHDLQVAIEARNAGLKRSYPYLVPDQVACSITA